MTASAALGRTAWAVTVCCVPPGLALLIARTVARPDETVPTAVAIALQNVTFAAGMFAVAIAVTGRGAPAERARSATAWLWVPVLAAGAVVGHSAAVPIVVLLAALVEELVFRRSVPQQITKHLGHAWWHRGLAVLLAQASFALAHVIGRPAEQWDALPLLRLVTAGILLASVYASAGLLPAALLHAFINESLRTGWLGPFRPPGLEATVAVTLTAVAMVAVQAACPHRSPAAARATAGSSGGAGSLG